MLGFLVWRGSQRIEEAVSRVKARTNQSSSKQSNETAAQSGFRPKRLIACTTVVPIDLGTGRFPFEGGFPQKPYHHCSQVSLVSPYALGLRPWPILMLEAGMSTVRITRAGMRTARRERSDKYVSVQDPMIGSNEWEATVGDHSEGSRFSTIFRDGHLLSM